MLQLTANHVNKHTECATCPNCWKNYIGQTIHVSAQMSVHKRQVKDETVKNPCSEHFANCGEKNYKYFHFTKCGRPMKTHL